MTPPRTAVVQGAAISTSAGLASGEKLAYAALLAVFVLFCNAFSAHDNDTGWHIRTGEIIATQRAIPVTDPFSETIQGRPWTAFEWLSDVVFYAGFRLAGVPGVIAIKALAAASAFLVMFWSARAAEFWAAACLACAAAVSQAAFLERPLVFDLAGIAALWALLTRPTRFERRLYWQVPLVIAVWTNLHGGAALVGCLFVVCECGDRLLSDHRSSHDWPACAVLSLAAFALNPHGLRLLGHAWSTVTFSEKSWVDEWRPLETFLSPAGTLLAIGAGCAALGLRRHPGRSLWLLALGAQALIARRHIPLFALPAAVAVAESVPRRASLPGPAIRGGALTALLCALSLYWWRHVYAPWGRSFGFSSYEDLGPALRFADERKISGRMFNPYDAGGAIIGLAYPARRVFIDSRNVEYGPELVRDAVAWEDGWDRLAVKYAFDYALLFNRRDHYACRAIDANPEWRLVYWDDAALLYVRARRAAPRAAFSLLRPNQPSFAWIEPLISSPRSRELADELKRSLDVSGRGVEALLMNAFFRARRGESAEASRLIAEAKGRVFWKPQFWSDLAQVQQALGQDAAARRSLETAAAAEAAL